jgi:L-2-hydroxycarboxylate dehydrogenase (NAD+)
MDRCYALADQHGIGAVIVDNAFHYIWGGGYVIDAAKKGYIAYTNCTSALAEVVPFGGKFPTLGTNPHSWSFPTQDSIGFPVCIDWATSTVAMGRVQQFAREGKQLPPGSAVDAAGNETRDPKQVAALLPFGNHKGYGLSLIDELYAAYGGGSLPTLRGRPDANKPDEKFSACFYFQVTHPDALRSNNYAGNRDQTANVDAVLKDIRGHGNEDCLLPGQLEAQAAQASLAAGGLLFTQAEVTALQELAAACGHSFDISNFSRTKEQA